MKRDEFENLVSEAIENLPRYFREKMDNVTVVLEEWPTQDQLSSANVPSGGLLFGLYQGTPLPKRTSRTLYPDKITVFAGPILMVCRTEEEVKAKVTQVVKHEIAHHFGLSEEEIPANL